MKKFYPLIVLLSLVACAGGEKDKTPSPQFSEKMNKAARSLQELLPYLYNAEKFSNKKEAPTVKKKLSNFKSTIHDIKPEMAKDKLGDDPYVHQSLSHMGELTERSIQAFQRQDYENARILMKATTNVCFKCHTRQVQGQQDMAWGQFDIEKIDTNPIEKAHLLVAMRQYEDAKLYLANFLSEKEREASFDTHYETGLHYYLMISLRGQQTFESTLNFITVKLSVNEMPTELRKTLEHWRKDLEHWNTHASRLKSNLKHARGVLKRNKKRYSHKNLVNNLVSSSLLHQNLAAKPSQMETARIYSTLGYIYDELIVEGFWDLPEFYYEMCIRYAPKSPVAKTCFRQISNNITLGYTGSRGTSIPQQEYDRLEELRKLAGL